MAQSNQQIAVAALNRIGGIGTLAPLGGVGNSLGASSQYQKMVEQAKQQAKPIDLFGAIHASLTRFDPSTKTRVPVTQEWVDEAVAEIVRLNIELGAKAEPMPGTDMLKVDRIWEAVRAASAV
jgi:hypothetical protein